jgi:hypothetical protein
LEKEYNLLYSFHSISLEFGEGNMEENETVEFGIQVSLPDATDHELDSATRQLLSEVRELNVESAELIRNETGPMGSKGDPITIGSIAIAVLPPVLPSVVALVQAWVMRGQGRTVKFKGKGIEFEGSPEELQKLLTSLEKQKKKTK